MARANDTADGAPAAEVTAEEAQLAPGFHMMTITKKGHGKVHTGVGVGETFNRGDRVPALLATAHALEERAYAEADDELPPLPADGAEGDEA